MNISRRSSTPRTYSALTYRLLRPILAILIGILFRPRAVGRDNIPANGPCFLISNHCTMYDSLFMNYFVRRVPFAGIITDEFLREGGFFPAFFKKMGVVTFRKFSPQPTPVRQIMRLVQDQRMIVIMPEGESNWDGVTLPTIASTGKLFRTLQVPVYPVVIHNSYMAFPRWAKWPRPIKIHVEFKPPLSFKSEMTDEQAADMVDQSINWDPHWDRSLYHPRFIWGLRMADGITRLIFRCPDCGQSEGLREVHGRYLHCYRCGTCWRVTADYHLLNTDTGDKRFITDVFRDICRLPRPTLDYGPQGRGLLRSTNIPVFREVKFPHYKLLGHYDCILREDRIDFLPLKDTEQITIPLDQIDSTSCELKTRYQIRTPSELYQLDLKSGSSLQWEFYLLQRLPHLDRQRTRPVNYAEYQPPVLPPDLKPIKE